MNGAQEKVKVPALGLVATGILGILGAIFVAVSSFTSDGQPPKLDKPLDKDQQAMVDMFTNISKPVSSALAVVGLLGAIFVIYGGHKMRNLQSYGMAVTAAIVAMIPAISPCCCLGVPIGIWALVVLLNQDVKSAFH
jgi:hypothetical protein